MSTPAPLHPVRQQLDELDGLLQRMLELPVEPTTEDSPHSEEKREGANGKPVALDSSWREFENTSPSFADCQFSTPNDGSATAAATSFPFLAPTVNEGEGTASPQVQRWALIAGPSNSEPAEHAEISPLPAQTWHEETPYWLWPLVAAQLCGGRLPRPAGKAWAMVARLRGTGLPGVLGLLLLAGALLWGLLDWIQWTW